MANKVPVSMTINGIAYERLVEPRRLLVDFIRQDLELTGTHVGCEHGICGSCTVLFNGRPVRSCLMFAVQADGAEIMTIEGLAKEGKLHPIQEAFRDNHGLQCGFCTPGQLMIATHLLAENPDPSEEDIREAMAGVLCRCTGYKQVIDSVKAASEKLSS